MSHRIQAIGAVRFLVSVFIVIHHLSGLIGLPLEFFSGMLRPQGVTAFCVVSGFVLALAYRSFDEPRTIRRYYIGRIARLWPAHLAVLLILIVLARYGDVDYGWMEGGGALVTNILLLQSWIPIPSYFFGYNSVTWSLSAVATFSLAYPWILPHLKKSYWPLVCALLLSAVIAMSINIANIPNLEYNRISGIGILSTPVYRLSEFILGATAGLFFLRTKPARAEGGSKTAATLLEIMAIAVFLLANPIVKTYWVMPYWSYLSHGTGYFILHTLTEGISATIFVYVLALGRGYISALLSNRLFAYLGAISFAIYLTHRPIILFFNYHFHVTGQGLDQHLWLAGAMVSIIIASILLHHLIENPAKRLILRLR